MSRQFDDYSPTHVGPPVDGVDQSDLIEQSWTVRELRQVVELAADALVIFDDHGQIVLVNAQTEQLFGYDRHELLGQSVEILMPDRFRFRCREQLVVYFANPCARAMGSGLELDGLSIEGSEFTVDVSLSPIETAGGVIVSSAIRYVTGRKQTASAVDESRILAEAIVETVREPLLILDENLYVQSANQSFYQTFEVTPLENENQLVYELGNHQWNIPQLRHLLEHVLPDESQFNGFEVQHRFERIGERTMLLNARKLDREGERPGLILLAIEDITDRKQADEELKHIATQLQRYTRELERSNGELQDFAYVVAHDFRAPLVNIQGFSKELALSCKPLRSVLADAEVPESKRRELSALLDEDIPEALEFIATNATKMEGLLSGVLQLSRVGQAALTIRPLDINQMLSEIVASRQFAIDQAGASVQIDTLPNCQGDEMQINQVFSNLLDNALKYLDPNRLGMIRVCGQQEPDGVVYSIEDNGIGIAAQHQDSIYKVFHRLDPRRGTGEGLGLTIVRRILARHGGKVWVKSEVNEGSKFYLSLPKGECSVNIKMT